jgi:hypothetical protein
LEEADGDGFGGMGDGIGDVCDPTPGGTGATCSDGSAQNDDQDCDGYKNRQDNCPLVANGCQTAACHPTLFSPAWNNQLDNDLDLCGNATSDDGVDDANRVNDGCPLVGSAPESASQCSNNTDDDGDTAVNDGCPMSGAYSEVCVNTADGGPCNDAIGNSCDNVAGLSPILADGAYAEDLVISPVCIGAADDGDSDGWCDATETLLGSNALSNTSTPEHTALDYKVGGVTIAGGVCSDLAYYTSVGDDIAAGAAVDNDGNGGSNAGEADGADPGAVADCAVDPADGTDQDGVYAGATALWNGADSCPNDWNPEQRNTDAVDDATGDACDTDDDADGLTDINEWKRGTDPKNFYSPRMYDVNNDGGINILDVLTFGGVVDVTARPIIEMRGQGKQQPWTYTFTNNTGFAINRLRVEFWDAVKLMSITDSASNTWSCLATGLNKLGCMIQAGTVPIGGTITISASSNAQRELVCWLWASTAVLRGGSWNSTDCAVIPIP